MLVYILVFRHQQSTNEHLRTQNKIKYLLRIIEPASIPLNENYDNHRTRSLIAEHDRQEQRQFLPAPHDKRVPMQRS